MVEPGLFVEQTIWGKLKGREGWAIWRSRGRALWQREKTTQWSEVRESWGCSRRLGCPEGSEWAADVVKEQAGARHAGGGLHFARRWDFSFPVTGSYWGVLRKGVTFTFLRVTLLQCREDCWKARETRRSTGTLEKSKQTVKKLVAVEVEGSYQSQMWFEGKARRTRRWMEGMVVRGREQSEWHLDA